MHPDLAKLVVLQEFDIEAKRLRDHIAALPRQVATLELKLAATQGQRSVVVELIAKEDALRRRLESDIADQRLKLTRTQKKIDAATSTIQVTALEHETAFARAEINRLEDAELESMERSEQLDAQLTIADNTVAELAVQLERERVHTAELLAVDRASLADVDAKRAALRVEISQSDTGDDSLATYDRISRSKGTAVSQAIHQQCSACRIMIRPQRWNDLRDNSADSESSHAMMTCENCGHLLYYDPARDTPQPKPVRSESIAAQIVRSSI